MTMSSLSTNSTCDRIGIMSKSKTTKPAVASTSPRTFRLDTKLIEGFEADCSRNLRRPAMVLEALIHHWLTIDPKAQMAIANSFNAAESRRARGGRDE